MKNPTTLLFAIFLCIGLCMPSLAMAQKQGRVEKLLKYLSENELEKYQKNREKLDAETAQAFEKEIGVIDAMDALWNKSDMKAIKAYYICYEQAMKAAFPGICADSKIDIATLRSKTDKAILALLKVAETDKLSFSKLLLDNIRQTQYPVEKEQMIIIEKTRENALVADIEREPVVSKFQTFFSEYPHSQFNRQMKSAHNTLLYELVKKSSAENDFKVFFNEASIDSVWGGKSSRPYMTEVKSLYDDYLYALIQKSDTVSSIRKCIDDYKNTPYLNDLDKKHLTPIEYLNDQVDYELLKAQVNSASKLGLIKAYLLAHKYKEFRDKANDLRTPFEAQILWTTPSTIHNYSKGLLLKSSEVEKEKTISNVYTYNNIGQPGSIETSIEDKNGIQKYQTNLFYDALGRYALEIQINPTTKKEIYKRIRSFGANGEILSDSTKYTNGQLILRSYNKQGLMTEEKVCNNKGEMTYSAVNQYNEKGSKIRSHQLFPLGDKPTPNQVLSQIDVYEYNTYGYLTKLAFENIMANTDKSSGSLTFLYDEYGNKIDSNTYYEYDHTGRWVRKTNQANSEDVERLQCTYE